MGTEFLKDKKIYLAVSVAVISLFLLFTISPPVSFPSNSIITVSEGTGLYTLSLKLDDTHVVRSPFWFRIFAITLGGERDMKAGEYYMSKPENSFVIAWRIFHGDYDIETLKITIPEGFTVQKISNLFDQRFSLFDHAIFESIAPEGYLFPDTYFVPVSTTASSAIKMFRDNFEHKLEPLESSIKASGRTFEEIIIMASILEREVVSEEDKRIASGILWKRLKLGMPLQVDSDPDTYKHKGFPPEPISNPGLESIETALFPTLSPYLYFLTGDDGATHYAKTFEEHKSNKLKYLK